MLLRFVVENYKSFKGQTEFNMSAGKFVRHSDHTIIQNGKRILKGGFLFGANAGGKSNFVQAIAFARNAVIEGLEKVDYEKSFFRIENEFKSKPGIFQFDILSNGYFYSYGFALSYLTGKIEEEWLYKIGDSHDVCVFLRHRNESDQSFVIETDLSFPDEKQELRFRVYSEDICSPKMGQVLFLSDIAERSPDEVTIYQPFLDVYEWFRRLIIIFPTSQYSGIMRLLDDDNKRIKLANLLEYYDTGIIGVSKIQTDLDKVFSGEDIEELKKDIAKGLKENREKALVSDSQIMIEVQNKEGTLIASEIRSNHGNQDDLFDFRDESDGTRRLFDLIPIYQFAMKSRVILVDELDRSLHTKVTQEFIRYFYEITKDIPSQLIVTTQDSNIMDLNFIRQDEIWFVERGLDHSSKLYSLNQYKVRFDKKVERDYLLGRFGAIPVFHQLEMLDEYDEESGGINGEN